MKIKLLTLFLLFQLGLQSQTEFAPAHSEWYYDAIIGWGGSGIVKANYTKDTMLYGLSLKVIERTEPSFTGPYLQTMFIHQSHDTIYQALDDGSGLSFYFLFRNEMNLGETVSFPVLYPPSDLIVEEKAVVNFDGKNVVRYLLTDNDAFSVHIYDVFGPEYGFFSHWLGSAFDGNDYYLRCYRADAFPLVNLSGEPCAGINATDDKVVDEIAVSPVPTGDFLNIEMPYINTGSVQVSIFDLSGKQVLSGKTSSENNSMAVSCLHPGVYLGTLTYQHHAYRFKFVKQ